MRRRLTMIDKKRSIPTKIIEGNFEAERFSLSACGTPVRKPKAGKMSPPAGSSSDFAQSEKFRGNLIVKGNIGDNYIIQAERDIQIDGSVGASVVRAGGSILVKKGVFGRGCLDARGDIEVGSVENGSLISGKNITIHQGAMHSRLAADKEITVAEGKGILAGGKAKAGIAITAKRIGSPHITPTLLEVGIPPLFRDERQRLKEKIELLRKQVDQAEKATIHIEKLSTEGCTGEAKDTCFASSVTSSSSNVDSSERSGEAKQLSRVQKLPLWRFRVAYLNKELEKYNKRFETLEKILSAPSDVTKGNGHFQNIESMVNVAEEIYPGVKISIAWTVLEIMEILRGVTFFAEGGKIQWIPFVKDS